MEYAMSVQKAVDADDTQALRDFLNDRVTVSADCFPDEQFLRLWERVCRGESRIDVNEMISSDFFSVNDAWGAVMFYLCSPERTLVPTGSTLAALCPMEEFRTALVARIVDAPVRLDIIETVVHSMNLFEEFEYKGHYFRVALTCLWRYPQALDDVELIDRIVAYAGDAVELLNEMYDLNEVVLESYLDGYDECYGQTPATDSFETYYIFERIATSCSTPPVGKVSISPTSLFGVAILHLVLQCGWEVDTEELGDLANVYPDLPYRKGFNLPLSLAELQLATESLRIVLKMPRTTIEIDPAEIDINHSNWYRSRFLQECLARVGVKNVSLFAVDSPVVAKWIVANGNAQMAMKKFRAARGDMFKIQDVQSCILEMENIKKQRII
jgi:hypothetical protein